MKKSICLALLMLLACRSFAETSEERDARMKWWREARFGMFVHWGLYSIPAGEWNGKKYGGGVEWIQKRAEVPATVYEQELIPKFKPKQDFAAEWAKLAKEAGCKYVVFTTKHHEGFCLHNSKFTKFDAQDACGRDLVKEISDAVRGEGLKLGYYHSVIDWHHQHAYAGFGLPTIKGAVNEGRSNDVYVAYLHGQVRELLGNYGKVDVIWWDFSTKDCQGEKWRAPELMALVRKAQPEIIMNNRLYASSNVSGDNLSIFDVNKGDFTTPEQHIPERGLPGVDWETCMTMNDTWGYSAHDKKWKSSAELVKKICDSASKGGNFLLNIGPMADGTVPPESVVIMQEIGRWMGANGEAIYGTTANPLSEVKWGRITAKKNLLYLHVFDVEKDTVITLPGSGTKKAYMLTDGDKTPLKVSKDGREITLNKNFKTGPVTVVVAEK